MLEEISSKTKGMWGKGSVTMGHRFVFPKAATTVSFLCVSSKVFWKNSMKAAQETKNGTTL